MNSLLGYGSDDDYEDSSEEKPTDRRELPKKQGGASTAKQQDVNYEEVQMDLSEESNESKSDFKECGRRSRERESSRREESKNRHDRDDYRSRRDDRNTRDKDSKRNDRYKRERKGSKRSTSRERRRSRSPRRSEKESKYSRSRSRSRERNRKYSKRYDRIGSKTQVDKTDVQKSADEEKRPDNRFFTPGVSGRFRDQIERRKLLWQKKEAEPQSSSNDNNGTRTTKVWEATTFAQDTDGKVASKFKRLMGIRGAPEPNGPAVDVLKKQEEMFSSMEQQYEVARTATHTMRGVGLGFSSFQR